MNIQVRYYSRTGNTKKIADAIAKEAGVKAKTIDAPVNNLKNAREFTADILTNN